MRFYNNADELIENELPIKKRAYLYPVIEDGFRFYKEFTLEHSQIFESEFFSNVKGHLLSYIINRHFQPDMVSKNFPFIYVPEKVNNFGHKSGNLRLNNVLINISRERHNGLPNKSKYRIQKCSQNNFNNVSLFFDTDARNNLFVNNELYYCFLVYDVQYGELNSVNLIVPDDKMTCCIKKINLQLEYSVYDKPIEEPVNQEIKIAKLKKEIIEKLKNVGDNYE